MTYPFEAASSTKISCGQGFVGLSLTSRINLEINDGICVQGTHHSIGVAWAIKVVRRQFHSKEKG